jgi:lipoprotein-releasing system ATP-binding protein
LEVRELRKGYLSPSGAAFEVLRGVTFALAVGEMLAVMGASGAGKSTLLHLLGGLDAADGGSARLGRIELTRTRGAELARVRNEQVGFVFQFHHLLPDLSALENVALPLLVARRKPREASAAARAMLAAVGLSERAAHRPGELSGGEQQRAAIARALVHEPRLVLADEPTGNLDARTGAEIAALLSTLARTRRAAVVVATHNEQLAAACDRTLVLRDGRLLET